MNIDLLTDRMVNDRLIVFIDDCVNNEEISNLFNIIQNKYFSTLSDDGALMEYEKVELVIVQDNIIFYNTPFIVDVNDLQDAVILREVNGNDCNIVKLIDLAVDDRKRLLDSTGIGNCFINKRYEFDDKIEYLIDLVGKDNTRKYLVDYFIWQSENVDCFDYNIPCNIRLLV